MKKNFSIIIPLYKNNWETLDDCLFHLKEQDYKFYEIIFSHNSPDDESKKAISRMSKLLDKWKISWKEIDAGYDPKLERGNHCRAFNKGAEISTGDYLIFLDPDCYLMPGILREYALAFENSDADFIYGAYEFKGQGSIDGKVYNEYELRCANYISGAFPIKKESFKGWDENLQSLQDWDMRLNAVDAGAKGFWIGPRICFQTEPPKEDGISAHSHNNWLDIYNKVREKHNFPTSKTAVTSIGAPLHATKVAKILGVDTRVFPNFINIKPHEYENIMLLGFYPEGYGTNLSMFHDDISKPPIGKKRIIYWIGTDIYNMRHKVSFEMMQSMKRIFKKYKFINITEAEHTHKELKEMGFNSVIIPIPPEKLFEPKPLPKEFTVGVYINPTQDMYHEKFMGDIAKAMPDIKFKFFGGNQIKKIGNSEWVGFLRGDDYEKFLESISCMVRLTVHDGLPISPLEAITMGRNVLCSTKLPHMLHAEYKDNSPQKKDIISKIREMQKMPLNIDGSKYWIEELSHEKFKERINNV